MLQRCNGLFVRDAFAKVEPDRNPVAEPSAPEDHTRVLVLYGKKEVVNVDFLTNLLSTRFEYQVDEIVHLATDRVVNMIEQRFGSYRCQAKWAWRNIESDAFMGEHGVTVRLCRDPCDL